MADAAGGVPWDSSEILPERFFERGRRDALVSGPTSDVAAGVEMKRRPWHDFFYFDQSGVTNGKEIVGFMKNSRKFLTKKLRQARYTAPV